MSTEPRQLSENERSGPKDKVEIINVYVCPTSGCGNYFGSSDPSFTNLEKQNVIAPAHAKDAGRVRFQRSRCPNCGADRKLRYARLVPESEVNEVLKKLHTS